MASRTFKLQQPLMSGKDIEDWQTWLKSRFRKQKLNRPGRVRAFPA